MINSNSSVIIKNHDNKNNKKCSMDSDNSEDDEDGDNKIAKNIKSDEISFSSKSHSFEAFWSGFFKTALECPCGDDERTRWVSGCCSGF